MGRLVALSSVAILVVVLGLGQASGASMDQPTADRMQIVGLRYRPNPNTVAPGTLITVGNLDGYKNGIPHSLTSEDGLFDTGVYRCCFRRITAPEAPGTYRYFCQVHSFMRGRLIVSGIGTTT
jgi:plastocyanin